MAITDTLRKVPTWGWLLVGGATLGVGYSFYRDRKNPKLDGAAGEASLQDGLTADNYGYYGTQPAPIGVISPPAPYSETGQIGAIGQTAFESFTDSITGIIGTIPALIEAGRGEPVPINIVMPQAPAPAAANPPVVPATPHTPAAPGGVTIEGKHFPGAYRFAPAASPNTAGHDFNVFYHKPHKDERWRHKPNGSWAKVTEGNFGG